MKPRLWFRQGWWHCGYLYGAAKSVYDIAVFRGATPYQAYNAWKFREMVVGL